VSGVQDVEDLVSQTFLKALEGLHRFEYRGAQSFANWLFRIAHNLVSDFYSRNQRRGEVLVIEDVSMVRATGLLPDAVVIQQEQFAYLRQLIATLSPRRQEVITLKFFAGLRNREIAEILGVDERAVASHLCRGLEDLYQRYIEATPLDEEEKH
jgi:RNA polymerase sigma-70 factor (ECF subfamily)